MGAYRTDGADGPIASRILYEDDAVRIWEMVLEPGETSGRHRHEHDYVVVMVEGDRVGLFEHARSDGAPGGYREANVAPGRAVALRRGGVETVVNPGSRRYCDVEIELLRRPGDGV